MKSTGLIKIFICFFILPVLVFISSGIFKFYFEAKPALAQEEIDYKSLGIFSSDEVIPEPKITYYPPGQEPPYIFNTNKIRAVEVGDKSPFNLGTTQIVFNAPSYALIDWGKTTTLSSFKNSVGEILKDNSVELAQKDQVSPELGSPARNLNTIKITRVTETELKKVETIPYQTLTRDDPTLPRGQIKVTPGVSGEKEIVYKVVRENGEEKSRILISEKIVEKPTNKVILNGTKIIVLSSISGEASWTNTRTAMRNYRRGTHILVTNLSNGKRVEVVVGDHGPEEGTGRILDLERSAFEEIASLGAGTISVKVEEIAN